MSRERINSEVMIYSRDLRENSYKGKFPFFTEAINFDIETKVTSSLTLLNHNELDIDFNDVIVKGDYITFTFQDFKYFGIIDNYYKSDNERSVEIEVALNYDVLDFNFELYSLLDNDFPSENQIYNPAGGYRGLNGLSGEILAYARKSLTSTYPFLEDCPLFVLSDLTEEDEFTLNDIYDDVETFSDLVRYAHKIYGLKLEVNFANKILPLSYVNLPSNYKNNEGLKFIDCKISNYSYTPLEIYKNNTRQVVGDLDVSFQNDKPNILDLDVYIKNSEDDPEYYGRRMYIVCNDGVVREASTINKSQMPLETNYEFKRYDYDLGVISEDLLLSYAISEIGNNYINEITFKTTRQALGMVVNDKNIYNFFDILGRPVFFHLSKQRSVLSRITSIKVINNDLIEVKLGASRQRLTDKLRKLK